jgi:hypothetical protein
MNLTTISPIIAYSLNIQGNAQLWGKNTLILVGKYQARAAPEVEDVRERMEILRTSFLVKNTPLL